MRIKDAIDMLKNNYRTNDADKHLSEEVVIAWWDKDWFELMLDTKLSDDEWLDILSTSELVIENCDIGQYLMNEALETLKQSRKGK